VPSTGSTADRSVTAYPSGAVTTTEKTTEPELGSLDPSVYAAIDTACDPAAYEYAGVVPYAVAVDTESTHSTAPVPTSALFTVVAS
jgi:hypothetical protein